MHGSSKRPRGADEENDKSSTADLFEIVCGTSKSGASRYEAHYKNAHKVFSLYSGKRDEIEKEPSNRVEALNDISVASLFPISPHYALALRAFLLPNMDSEQEYNERMGESESFNYDSSVNPIELGVVRLIANDGKTLIFYNYSSDLQDGSDSSTSYDIPPFELSTVESQLAQNNIVQGDVVAFCRESKTMENSRKNAYLDSSSSYPIHFIDLFPEVIDNTEDWREIINRNVEKSFEWTVKLVERTPGIPQLTFLLSAAMQMPTETGRTSIVENEAWWRVLNFPKLLSSKYVQNDILERKEIEDDLKYASYSTLALLRIYINLFRSTENIASLPQSFRLLFYQFVSSPLFVEGLSTILLRTSQGFQGLTTGQLPLFWHSMHTTFMDAMNLCIEVLCDDHYFNESSSSEDDELVKQILGISKTLDQWRVRAEAGFLTVLHRLSKKYLDLLKQKDSHQPSSRFKNTEGRTSNQFSESAELVAEWLEELSTSLPFKQLIDWLEETELLQNEPRSLKHRQTPPRFSPPTLVEVENLQGLSENAVEEQLSRIKETYTPYLTNSAMPYISCACAAAYAEFYGPTARSLKELLDLLKNNSHIQKASLFFGKALKLSEVKHCSLQPDISSFSLTTISNYTRFGLPFELRTSEENSSFDVLQDFFIEESDSSNQSVASTLFCYILVMVDSKPVIFPIILEKRLISSNKSRVAFGEAYLLAYVMRQKDLLLSFIRASVVTSREGEANIWLVWSLPTLNTWTPKLKFPLLRPEPTRFLPPETSAMEYIEAMYVLYFEWKRLWRLQQKGSSISYSLNSAPSTTIASISALGKNRGSLWMDYFAERRLPNAFYNTAGATRTAGAAERDQVEGALQGILSDSFSLSPTQVESLHGLLALGSHSASVRIIEGVAGSGKSLLLDAAGAVLGTAMKGSRRQTQKDMGDSVKHAMDDLRLLGRKFMPDNDNLGNPLSSSNDKHDEEDLNPQSMNNTNRTVSKDLPLDLSVSVSIQTAEFMRLMTSLRTKTAPLMLKDPSELSSYELCDSLSDVVRESASRAKRSPLAQYLTAHMRTMSSFGNTCESLLSDRLKRDDLSENGDLEWILFPQLLPFVMSRSEIIDTTSMSQQKSISWRDCVRDIFGETFVENFGVNANRQVSPSKHWDAFKQVPSGDFSCVSLPPGGRRLTQLRDSELTAWRSVYGQKQEELIQRMQHALFDEIRLIFNTHMEIITAVALTSQIYQSTVIQASHSEILKNIFFVRRWCPETLIVDDMDLINDSFLPLLPYPTTLMVSISSEAPPLREKERTVPVALLRAVRRELKGSSVLATATLRDYMRCLNPKLLPFSHYLGLGHESADTLLPTPLNEEGAATTDGLADQAGVEGNSELPTLISQSPVELWTHAVPSDMGVRADAVSSAFLVKQMLQHTNRSKRLSIITPFEEDVKVIAETINEAQKSVCLNLPVGRELPIRDEATQETIGIKGIHPDHYSVHCLPFKVSPYSRISRFTCDIAIVSLSGFCARLLTSADASTRSRKHSPTALWKEATADSTLIFSERLQYWLWMLFKQVRYNVIFVGSKELFCFVPDFTRLERMIHVRRGYKKQKSNPLEAEDEEDPPEEVEVVSETGYWLPETTESAVLGLCCLDHSHSRQTAIIQFTQPDNCVVRVNGTIECRCFCLKPYHNCKNPSHACISPCHLINDLQDVIQRSEVSGEVEEPLISTHHLRCPYPCNTKMNCGHFCDRPCGEKCAPCSFIGLRELKCTQRVVSGNGPNGIQFEYFPHFQEIRCGEAPLPCRESVRVTCDRCGTKTSVPCRLVIERGGWFKSMPAEGNQSTPLLNETECCGCVFVYNKVTKKHGLEEATVVPLPTLEEVAEIDEPFNEADSYPGEDSGKDFTIDSSAPTRFSTENWPPEALADLNKERYLASEKAKLMSKKEALEISSRKNVEKTDYAKYKAQYERSKALQNEQEQKRLVDVRQISKEWANLLNQKYDEQIELNKSNKAVLPSLISTAEAEAERQRKFYEQ